MYKWSVFAATQLCWKQHVAHPRYQIVFPFSAVLFKYKEIKKEKRKKERKKERICDTIKFLIFV